MRFQKKKRISRENKETQKQRGNPLELVKKYHAKFCKRTKTVPINTEYESSTDNDSDGDALEERMIRALNKEKQTLRNWKNVILRV